MHPAGEPCAVIPLLIQQREVMAGWSGGRCPVCASNVPIRRGRMLAEVAIDRVFKIGDEQKKSDGR